MCIFEPKCIYNCMSLLESIYIVLQLSLKCIFAFLLHLLKIALALQVLNFSDLFLHASG
jgi:hypothetical protein